MIAMSLRRRLVLGMVALMVAAIAVTDVVTYSSLRSFLLGRLDEQTGVAQSQVFVSVWAEYRRALAKGSLLAERHPTAWLIALGEASGAPLGGSRCTVSTTAASPAPPGSPAPSLAPPRRPRAARFDPLDRVSPEVFEEVLAPDHRLLFDRPSGTCDPRPLLPAHLPVQAAPVSRSYGVHGGPYFPNQASFDTAAVGSSGATYRAEAVQLPGGILITAVALAPDEQTLASVMHIEILVSLVVLVGAVVLALGVAGYGLRPLREMTETAGAIAEGDLARRIRTDDEHSEVGRLGHALNGMLGQIEAAFAARGASERRLRRFVADASHELRTPLTSIRGYAELLRKGALEDPGARVQAAARIEREAARMGVLVDDLLLLARLDQGRALDRHPVELRALVEEALAAVASICQDHHLALEPGEPVTVAGDGVRIRQIVDNLVGNAIVHTPPGTEVTVSVRRELEEAVLRVADTGPGMTAAQAAQVFDRFYRASSARTGTGAGLGLSIVAALAQAHGGTASVKSTVGVGTVFEVRLPAGGTELPHPAAKGLGSQGVETTASVVPTRSTVPGTDNEGTAHHQPTPTL